VSLRAEVVVVGLGATGAAALDALARRGVEVLGIDQFHPPHALGSSHGRSRIIREAYYESPAYVPLVQAAYEGWARLAEDSGQPLLRQTGGLMLGSPASSLIHGARESADRHGLSYRWLEGKELSRRVPDFRLEPGTVGLFEPRAGILDPESCITALLTRAAAAGARILAGTNVARWRRAGDGFEVETSRGTVSCGSVVLAAGPWLPSLLGKLRMPLSVERQVMLWFRPGTDRFDAARLPVFLWEWMTDHLFYGIPDTGAGLKVARHHEGEVVSPESIERKVGSGDIEQVRELLRRFIPLADGPPVDAATCLYTNTPDHHFVLGPHPGEPRVILASPCSGHGFKFAVAVGEVVSGLVLDGGTRFDIGPFSPARLLAV